MGARPAATALPSRDAVRTRRRERELRAALVLFGGGAAHLTLGWVLALRLAPDQPWALVVGPFLTLGGFIAGTGVLVATLVGGAIGWTSGMLTRQPAWRAGAA